MVELKDKDLEQVDGGMEVQEFYDTVKDGQIRDIDLADVDGGFLKTHRLSAEFKPEDVGAIGDNAFRTENDGFYFDSDD